MIFQHVMHRLGFVFRPIRRMFRSMISKTIQLSDLLPSIDQLQTGKQLSVSLAVKEGKVELEGVMIEGWGNQGSIDGSIIM